MDLPNPTQPCAANILVVDNEIAQLSAMSEMLGAADFSVVAQDALALTEAEEPDLILLDVLMLGINGFNVFKRLKHIDKPHNIPVIFIAASNCLENKSQGFQLGGIDYITKTFIKHEALARVTSHLRNYHLFPQIQLQLEPFQQKNHLSYQRKSNLHNLPLIYHARDLFHQNLKSPPSLMEMTRLSITSSNRHANC